MLVAQLTSVHPADDVRIYVKQCRTLAEAGYRVSLVAPDGRLPNDGSPVQIVPVRRREARLARMVATTWDVFQCTRALSAKIVHFHDPELIPAGILLKVIGRRVIYDVHENVPDQVLSKDWLPRALRGAVSKLIDLTERVSARLFDAVVAATPDIARRFPAHKTVIVQNFPLLSEFASGECVVPGRIRRDLVYVGNIADIRGVIEMVEAMAILQRERPGMCLNVAGRFLSVSLEERVRAMDGATAARFLGWQSRDQVSKLLSSALAGLVVLHPTPSYQRAYPVKLFEYMAAGIPVIASDFPLWRQIVQEAECGLLVDPHDPRAIADAAIWLCEHESEARAMGAAGAAAVRSRFNWSHEAEKLLRLYARLASS